MGTKKKKLHVPDKLQAWIDARKRHHLSDAHVQMARELGMNPKKLGKLDNHKQEPWKAPLPEFIEHCYEKQFGRTRPERVTSIEARLEAEAAKKAAKRDRKAAAQEAGAAPADGRQDQDQTCRLRGLPRKDGDENEYSAMEDGEENGEPGEEDDAPAALEERANLDPAEEVETCDYFEGRDLTDPHDLAELVERFVGDVEEGAFAQWEAAERDDQGLPRTPTQQAWLEAEVPSDDESDEHTIFVDDLPRPDRPWHELLLELARHLVVKPLSTTDTVTGVTTRGWPCIVACLAESGQGLSLPEGVLAPVEVVPAELRHDLWLQSCLDALIGLGQDEALTLEDPGQHARIDDLIENLRVCHESIRFLGVTLAGLMLRVDLPPRDRPIFARLLTEALGLTSDLQPLAERL
jgi:hypothetical protein